MPMPTSNTNTSFLYYQYNTAVILIVVVLLLLVVVVLVVVIVLHQGPSKPVDRVLQLPTALALLWSSDSDVTHSLRIRLSHCLLLTCCVDCCLL